MKDLQREHFRWSAHTGGLAVVKPNDYEAGGEVESHSPYSLWKDLRGDRSARSECPLAAGDLLETLDGDGVGRLMIAKYVGFEPAEWFVPAAKPIPERDAETGADHSVPERAQRS